VCRTSFPLIQTLPPESIVLFLNLSSYSLKVLPSFDLLRVIAESASHFWLSLAPVFYRFLFFSFPSRVSPLSSQPSLSECGRSVSFTLDLRPISLPLLHVWVEDSVLFFFFYQLTRVIFPPPVSFVLDL